MEFNNKHNEKLELKDGSEIYKSRSVAVVGHLLCKVNNELHILMVKRGKGCPDNVGMWCLPCGYLDGNESMNEAIQREIWEESGVNVFNIVKSATKLVYNDITRDDRPWALISDPSSDAKENVCGHYGIAFRADELPSFEERTGGEKDEVDEVRWEKLTDLNSHTIAFNHAVRIQQFTEFLIFNES